MKKKTEHSDQLSFDFDTPVNAQKPQVDRTTVRNGGFMSEIADADSYRWGRTKTQKTPNVLTADEVMRTRTAGAAAKQSETAAPKNTARNPDGERLSASVSQKPSPADMSPVPDAQVQKVNISPAAKMIMQRMKEIETNRTKQEDTPVRQTVADKNNSTESEIVMKKEIKAKVPEFANADISSAAQPKSTIHSKPYVASVHTDMAESVQEDTVKAYTPQAQKVDSKSVDDGNGIDGFRKQIVDSFEFDKDKFNEFFTEEPSAPVSVPASVSTDSVVSGGTAVFTAKAVQNKSGKSADLPEDDATKMMDLGDLGDFDFVENQDPDCLETINDYNNVDDAYALISDFSSRKSRLRLRSIISAVIMAALFALTFAEIVPFGLDAYYIAVTVLLVLGALVNLSIFSSFAALFKGRADTDFAPAFSITASIIQAVVCGFVVDSASIAATSLLAAASMLSVTFNSIGKLYIVKRILLNLDFITNEEYKTASSFISSPESSRIADPARVGESLIIARRKAIDMNGFIDYSLSADPYESGCYKLMIASVVVSAVAVAASIFTSGDTAAVLTAFATVAAVFAPLTSLSAVGRRLYKLCKSLSGKGTMLSGYKAAEDISEANVVAVRADELFCDDGVSLYNFKTFNDCPIDNAIIIAAALTKEGNSPLAGMFNEIVATNSGKLPAVDTVIYEQKMGLTGWVDNRKTLIGNRMILESHNIPVPPISVDKKIISSGKFPVYLAVDDKIAAIFIVGYQADRNIVHSIRRLINTGITLLVDTSDPNITEKLIADKYGIPEDTIVVMSADSARRLKEQTQPVEREDARMITSSIKGFVDGYTAAYNYRQSAMTASVVTVIMTCLGAVMAVVMPALGMGEFINVTSVIALHLLNYIFVLITRLFSR